MDHITEDTLEKLHLAPNEFSGEEKFAVESHLEQCFSCRDHYLKLKEFYNNVQENLNLSSTERERAFAEKLLARKRAALPLKALEKTNDAVLDSYVEIAEPYRGALVRRIVRFIRFHPIRFASATLLSAAVLVLALMSIHPSKDTNPSYVRAKDEFLVVYNTHGEELWRKHIGERFDASAYEVSTSASVGPEKYHVVFDVDGDGTNEVLSIFGWTGLQTPLDNMIFCYNADGSERWKYTLHRQMTFGSVTYNDSYRFYTLAVGNYGGNGTSEVVAVAGHFPWVPSDIIRLNGNDGKYSSEFWHPGRLEAFAHKHIEGRHEDELLFAGKNGLYGQAAILVMDPRQISGAAPMPDSSRPAGIAPGTEKYYVLIPGSDLQKFWNDPSAVDAIDFANDGTLEVIVNEKTSGHQTAQLHFIFDSTLSCIRVSGSNTFTWIHDEYAKEGKIATVLNDRYFDELRKNVRYWDGDKFVTDRTINRHYIEAIGKISIP